MDPSSLSEEERVLLFTDPEQMIEAADDASEGEPDVQLVPIGAMKMSTADGKGTLELVRWRDEPAVVLDGYLILRRSVLMRQVAHMRKGKLHDCDL